MQKKLLYPIIVSIVALAIGGTAMEISKIGPLRADVDALKEVQAEDMVALEAELDSLGDRVNDIDNNRVRELEKRFAAMDEKISNLKEGIEYLKAGNTRIIDLIMEKRQ